MTALGTPAAQYATKLPVEILSNIFQLSNDNWISTWKDYTWSDSSATFPYTERREALEIPPMPCIVVVQVCQQWARAAIGHKKLWTRYFHLTPNKLASIPRLSCFLKRSQNQLLDVVIRAQNMESYPRNLSSIQPWTPALLLKVLNILHPHASRIRVLSLAICIEMFDSRDVLPLSGALGPSLESLDIIHHKSRDRPWTRNTNQFVPEDSSVRVLAAHDTAMKALRTMRIDSRTLQLPLFTSVLRNLTVLEIRSAEGGTSATPFPSINDVGYANIFNHAPQLVHVTFLHCRHHSDRLEYTAKAKAPNLEVLRSYSSDVDGFLWACLEAPKLKDLVLEGAEYASIFEESKIDPNAAQKFPLLERLVLIDSLRNEEHLLEEFTGEDAIGFASITPSITQLVLLCSESDAREGTMLTQMLNIGADARLWPKLRVIKLAHADYAPNQNPHPGASNVRDLAAGLVAWRRETVGVPCVLEVDDAYFYAGDGLNYTVEELLSREAMFKALVEEGHAQRDKTGYHSHLPPVQPPLPGKERPTDIWDLWYIDQLGFNNYETAAWF